MSRLYLGTGRQDPDSTIYAIAGNARKWAAALAARSATNPARLVFSGDSLAEGATPASGASFVDKVRRTLAYLNGDRQGPGWINAAPDSSLATNGVVQSAVVHPYKFRLTTGTYGGGGANAVQVNRGLAGYAFLLDVGSVLTLSDGANANTTAFFDTAEFHYTAKQAAGSAQLEIRIDGVLVQTVETQNGALTGTYESGFTYTWTGTLGFHTITVTAATNDAIFDGVYLAAAETVYGYNAGNAGDTFADVLTATNPGRFQAVKRIDADALLFLSGTNDYGTGTGTDLTNMTTNMTTAIANVRTAVAEITLGVVVPHPSSGRTSWVTTFAPAMRAVAATNAIPVCDLSWIITSAADPQSLLIGDGIHLSASGEDAYARLIGKFVTGSDVDWVDQLSTLATRLLSEAGYKFVGDGSGTAAFMADSYGSVGSHFLARQADGTGAAPTQTPANRIIGRFAAVPWGDTGVRVNAGGVAAIDFVAAAAATSTSAPTDIVLKTPGTALAPTERARILTSGGLQWSEFALPAGVANKIIEGARLSGSAHQLAAVMPDSSVRVVASSDFTDLDVNPDQSLRPTGALAETFDRVTGAGSAATVITTQTMYMVAVALKAGMTVTNLSFLSASTPAGTPTNWWFALYSYHATAPVLLRQTADQTTTAWAAQTLKTLALSSAYVVPTSGLYYLAIMMKATTVVNLHATTTNVNLMTLPPILSGTSTGTLTTTAPNPAATITPAGFRAYAYAS